MRIFRLAENNVLPVTVMKDFGPFVGNSPDRTKKGSSSRLALLNADGGAVEGRTMTPRNP